MPAGQISGLGPKDTLAETGRAIPDEAIGPNEPGMEEELELARTAEGKAMAAKLAQEAAERTGRPARTFLEPDGDVDDPTGHA